MSELAFVFVLFVVFAYAEINDENQNSEARNDFLRNTFGKILKSLIHINEQRFDTMKKLTKLQDSNVAMDVLRTGKHDTNHGSLLAYIILDDRIYEKLEAIRQYPNSMDSAGSETDINSEDNNSKKKPMENSLRAFKNCQKKAAKMCGKACVDAYKTTCSEYACSKKMKKTFKRECKISCENRFH